MSSFTDEHELKARRQRRQGRQAPPPANGATPSGAQSAEAARDLLRGLITNDGQHSEETPAETHAGVGDEPHPHAPEQNADSDSRIPGVSAQTRNDGEKINELIRRVKEGTPDTDADASSTIQQRRPKGTADLSPDAAPRRRATRPRVLATRPPHPDAGSKRNTRPWRVAATVLLAGIAALLITLSSVGGHDGPVSSSTSSSRLAAARPGSFADALRATIAAVAPQLQAVARRAAATAHPARLRHTAQRRRARPHANVTRHKRQTSPEASRPVAQSSRAATTAPQTQAEPSPPVTTAPQTTNYPSSPAPARTTSQPSATPQTPATSRSRPAGAARSDPFGGIGSCVKGC